MNDSNYIFNSLVKYIKGADLFTREYIKNNIPKYNLNNEIIKDCINLFYSRKIPMKHGEVMNFEYVLIPELLKKYKFAVDEEGYLDNYEFYINNSFNLKNILINEKIANNTGLIRHMNTFTSDYWILNLLVNILKDLITCIR